MFVPHDGSSRVERALPIAARLALAAGGSIVLLVRAVSIPMGYSPAQAQRAAFAPGHPG